MEAWRLQTAATGRTAGPLGEAVPAHGCSSSPSLILADEPTAALDSHRGRQVMELFRKVAHERVAAVIVVTHDQRSLDVFDRTYEMEDGRLLSGTSPAQH